MQMRALGRTGLNVSVLGFGCGNVGGLMVRGTPAEQERAVARAIDLGINYFDTAPSYGDGQSETNLGRVLKTLGARAHVGTKFRLAADELANAPAAIERSLDRSLSRLRLGHVDLLQLHNPVRPGRDGGAVSTGDVLDAIVPALQRLRQAGKIRIYGITALGDTVALHGIVGAGVVHTAQVAMNLLNPSAGLSVPAGFPAQDFHDLIGVARGKGVGTIVIRVFAAGALGGTMGRHPTAVSAVDPIASGASYEEDVRRAEAFAALAKDGLAGSLVDASLRFALTVDGVSTVLVGYSSLEHLETAAAAVGRGPLPKAALERLHAVWQDLARPR
jgi:aryl-alcohol dehydrogenase-like predicted oxidoreductase